MLPATQPLYSSQARPLNYLFWCGIDLRWAYAELLPSITKKTRCVHHASDILHDGLLRFALSSNPNRQQQPHAYLRTIVKNLILEGYRKDGLIKAHLQQHENLEIIVQSPEYLADVHQRLQLLNQIIADLPPRCRQVFIMFRIEGVTQSNIAAQLNISLNMVEKHLIRALLDIRSVRQQLLQ